MGVFYELKKRNPDKKFYSVGNLQICPNMKKITLEKVKNALEGNAKEVVLSDDFITKAYKPLARMLELAK